MARQYFFPSFLTLLICLGVVSADDVINKKGGQVLHGEITKVERDGLMLNENIDGKQLTAKHFFKDMESVNVDLPDTFKKAMSAFASGQFKEAQPLLSPIVGKYKGVPDSRIATAMITLGDCYVEMQEAKKAQAVYSDFAILYPDQKSRADVGLAKLALLEKKYDEALKLIDPFLKQSSDVQSPTLGQERGFCEAFYLAGQAYEAKKDFQKALEHYVKSAVIYSGYVEMAAKAQQRADALRKEHNPEKGTPKIYYP